LNHWDGVAYAELKKGEEHNPDLKSTIKDHRNESVVDLRQPEELIKAELASKVKLGDTTLRPAPARRGEGQKKKKVTINPRLGLGFARGSGKGAGQT